MTNDELYNELAFYTLSHPDPAFLHQHVVDAYAAQYECQTGRSPRPGRSGTVKSGMLFLPTVYCRPIECALVFGQAGHTCRRCRP
jgi:hypothetical protein